RRADGQAPDGGLSPPPSRILQPRRRPRVVGGGSRAAPPADSHRSAALLRDAGAAVPAGAAAPVAHRPVAHRCRRGVGMMARLQSADDVLLSGIVSASIEEAEMAAQDADPEYDPTELPRLLAPIKEGRADAVYGSRFQGGPHRVLFFWHSVGNNFLTLVSNMFTNLNLTDMETCYKMVRADVLKRLPLTAERFGIEVELTARLAQAGARIWELPISYSGRTYAEGKKITWRDGMAAMFHILRYN